MLCKFLDILLIGLENGVQFGLMLSNDDVQRCVLHSLTNWWAFLCAFAVFFLLSIERCLSAMAFTESKREIGNSSDSLSAFDCWSQHTVFISSKQNGQIGHLYCKTGLADRLSRFLHWYSLGNRIILFQSILSLTWWYSLLLASSLTWWYTCVVLQLLTAGLFCTWLKLTMRLARQSANHRPEFRG